MSLTFFLVNILLLSHFTNIQGFPTTTLKDSTYNDADPTTSGYTNSQTVSNTNAAIDRMQASHRRSMHSVLAVIVILTLVYFVCNIIRRWKVPDAADEESRIERGLSGVCEPTILIQYPEIHFCKKAPDMAQDQKAQQMISEDKEEPKDNEEPKQEDSKHDKNGEKNKQQEEKDKELSNGENAEAECKSANDVDTKKKKRKWFARLKRKEKIAGKTEKRKGKKNQNEEILASLDKKNQEN